MRTILHVDLDAFYAQVEMVRLGLDPSIPLAVQQWNGLIAINYAARAFHIKRHSTPDEAKKACPDIRLVHVATYKEGDTEPQYHLQPSYATHKVSLEPYRRASAAIFAIFKRFAKIIQRASVDEAFLDISDQVAQTVTDMLLMDNNEVPEVRWPDGIGIMVGGHVSQSTGLHDLHLSIAASIANQIRKTVLDELGYTCSAGVAHNKTLAKICSGLNKPNKQTILRQSQVLEFMRSLPFQKIRNLGGKLGDEIEAEFGLETCGELWQFSEEELMAKFGEATGVWIYEIIRGNCNDAVTERNLVKMLSCCKNFQPPIHQIQKAEYWISVLASEMYTRAHDDYEINERWPKTLTFHWRSHSESKSKSCAFPNRFFIRSPDDVLAKCLLLFRQTIDSRQTSSSSSSISSSSILTSCNQRKISISSLSFRLSGLGKEESSTSVATFFKKVTAEELANARRIELTSSASADNIYSCGTSKSSSSIGGIDSFFTNSMIEHRVVAEVDNNNKDDDFSHVCESCSKRIPLQELEEHQDYHLALKLQREITGDQIGMSPFSSSSQSLKRKSSAATKGGSSSSKKNSNTSTIAKFFKR